MTYSDSAPPILKSIKYHLFDGKPQYPSIFEVRWRHPKFWALPLARGGNFRDPDCYSCLLALRRAPIHSSLENRAVKSWVTESCIQAKSLPTEGRWPDKGLCTSTLKLIPIEYVHPWDDAGWQVFCIYTLLVLWQRWGGQAPRGPPAAVLLEGWLLAGCKLSPSRAEPPRWQANCQPAAVPFLASAAEMVHRNACSHASSMNLLIEPNWNIAQISSSVLSPPQMCCSCLWSAFRLWLKWCPNQAKCF